MELNILLNLLYSTEYVLHRFANRLEEELDILYSKGIDGLLDLFNSLCRLMESKEHTLASPMLSRNSVLGLYVRRMRIFFEKLPFDQVVALYNDLKKYIERKMYNTRDSDISIISKQEDYEMNKYVYTYIILLKNSIFYKMFYIYINLY